LLPASFCRHAVAIWRFSGNLHRKVKLIGKMVCDAALVMKKTWEFFPGMNYSIMKNA
jgi:hypothetical protein